MQDAAVGEFLARIGQVPGCYLRVDQRRPGAADVAEGVAGRMTGVVAGAGAQRGEAAS